MQNLSFVKDAERQRNKLTTQITMKCKIIDYYLLAVQKT